MVLSFIICARRYRILEISGIVTQLSTVIACNLTYSSTKSSSFLTSQVSTTPSLRVLLLRWVLVLLVWWLILVLWCILSLRHILQLIQVLILIRWKMHMLIGFLHWFSQFLPLILHQVGVYCLLLQELVCSTILLSMSY